MHTSASDVHDGGCAELHLVTCHAVSTAEHISVTPPPVNFSWVPASAVPALPSCFSAPTTPGQETLFGPGLPSNRLFSGQSIHQNHSGCYAVWPPSSSSLLLFSSLPLCLPALCPHRPLPLSPSAPLSPLKGAPLWGAPLMSPNPVVSLLRSLRPGPCWLFPFCDVTFSETFPVALKLCSKSVRFCLAGVSFSKGAGARPSLRA